MAPKITDNPRPSNCSSLGTPVARFSCVKTNIVRSVHITPPNHNEAADRYETLKELLFWRPVKGSYAGYEGCLIDRVMSKDDRSIELDELFKISYLECGERNLFRAMVAVYNILEEGCFNKKREELPLQKKLVPMRSGDNFGPSYHFFGSALLAMCVGDTASYIMLGLSHMNTRKREKHIDNEKMDIDMIGQSLGEELDQLLP